MLAFPPMRRLRARLAISSGFLLVLGSACVTHDFDSARAVLEGAEASEVRACLGTPDRFELHNGSEYLAYRREIGQRSELTIDSLGRLGSSSTSNHRNCEFLFRVGPNGIDGFGVRGRTASGLRDDQRCIVRLSACLARPR